MMYDLVVIGGGPAGYSAALEAAGLGLRIVLFEQDMIGGTCLNRGCVPTKFLVHVAELYTQMKKASVYGICEGNPKMDFVVTMQRQKEIIFQLRNSLEQLMKQKKIEIVQGKAQIIRKGMVCSGGKNYETKNILIATGSSPSEPFIDGAITSDELLQLDYIPETMKIIGGGVVAVEFAHIFNSFGTNVIMCIRGERILRKWDKELAIGLTQSMKRKGITILSNCSVEKMKEIEAEVTLSAVGRSARLDCILEDSLAIEFDNGIVVDEFGRTNISGIYAAGDVIAKSPQLAHIAMEQGKRIVRHIVGKFLPNPASMIECIYVHPEIASVGMDEAEAKNKDIKIITGKQTMYSNARTLITGGERGFIKLVVDVESLEILGAQLMCECASDIAGELALAINKKLTVYDLAQSVRPHPSFCEAVTEAAEKVLEKMR